MCDAQGSESPASPPADNGASQAEDRRQKRMAVGAVVTFALVVVGTVAVNWPSACERAARHLCPQRSSAECMSLSARIEAKASPELCTEQIAVLREIDDSTKGDARRYRYLGVIKTLVGEGD